MIDSKTIQQITTKVVNAAHPTKIIIFGSYAKGEADEGSDLDLLVIKPLSLEIIVQLNPYSGLKISSKESWECTTDRE